ncbi:MAG TPA: N-acetyltransferase [Pyrinomonadaceae bacterium]|nr:N-acetyltransferase [Pyrinomonadaceae bacterium]
MTTIREETPEDFEAVRRVNELAFGRPQEAALVEALRVNAEAYISLVAEVEGRVVGHIFFSPVKVESAESARDAFALAPMAVLPEFQSRGVGSRLVREGLEECLKRGHEVVFVLGHPEYYPRFGFEPTKRWGISCEFQVPEEVFMLKELRAGALEGVRGEVKYHPEFRKV